MSDDIVNAAMKRAPDVTVSEEEFITWETERMLWEIDTVQRMGSHLTSHSLFGTQSFPLIGPASLAQALLNARRRLRFRLPLCPNSRIRLAWGALSTVLVMLD